MQKKTNNNSDDYLVYIRICPGDRAKVMSPNIYMYVLYF